MSLFRLLFLAVFLLVSGPVYLLPQPGLAATSFEISTLELEQRDGTRTRFDIEIARTRAQMAQGLMHRKSLPQRAGMLFLYQKTQPVAFWMRNTFIPLDLLFIDESGKLVWIHKNAQPLDETHIIPPVPAFAVLEVNAGVSDQLGLALGDKVVFSAFEK